MGKKGGWGNHSFLKMGGKKNPQIRSKFWGGKKGKGSQGNDRAFPQEVNLKKKKGGEKGKSFDVILKKSGPRVKEGKKKENPVL